MPNTMSSYTESLVCYGFDMALTKVSTEEISDWLKNEDVPSWLWNAIWALEKYAEWLDENCD